MKIKRGDLVQVMVGDDAGGAPRKVLQILDDGRKVLVEGVNRAYKHVKRNHPRSPQGGRLSREMPVDISNVLFYCTACNRGVRVGYQYTADGSKFRICKKCTRVIGLVSPANPRRATPGAS